MKERNELPVMRGERQVRFICGALAGVLGGFEMAARSGAGKGGTVLWIAATAVAFGIAAAWLGDRFWQTVRGPMLLGSTGLGFETPARASTGGSRAYHPKT